MNFVDVFIELEWSIFDKPLTFGEKINNLISNVRCDQHVLFVQNIIDILCLHIAEILLFVCKILCVKFLCMTLQFGIF